MKLLYRMDMLVLRKNGLLLYMVKMEQLASKNSLQNKEMLKGPQGPQGPIGPVGPPGPNYTITDADYDAIANKAATRVDLGAYTTFVELETRLREFERNNYGVNRPEDNHIIRKKEFDSSTSAFVNEDRAKEIAKEIINEKLGFISNAEEGVF